MTGYRQACVDIISEIDESRELGKRLSRGRFIFYRKNDGNPVLGLVTRIDPPNGVCTVLRLTKPMLLHNEKINHLPVLSFFVQYSHLHLSTFGNTRKMLDLEIEEIPIFDIEIISKFAFAEFNNKLSNADKNELETLIVEFICYVSRTVRKANEVSIAANPSLKVQQSILQRLKIVKELNSLSVLKDTKFADKYDVFHERFELQSQIKNIYHMMSEQNLNLLPDYESRLSVLKETGFIDYNNNVLLKGRVACEINTGYELVLTELILDNFLGDFEPEEIVALLSAFVYEGRTKDEEPPAITPRLAKGKEKIREIYAKVQEVSERYQIPATQEEAEFLEKRDSHC